MIKILIGQSQTPLILPADAKLRFDLLSPLFESSSIPGSVVLPFEVDGKSNDALFKYARFIEVNRQTRLYDCQIYAGTYLICTGQLYCKKTLTTKYQLSIIINTLAAKFADKNIKGIDYGPDKIICTPADAATIALHATNVVQGLEPAPYTFPQVYNEAFYGTANPDFGGLQAGAETGKYINQYTPTGFTFNHPNPPSIDGIVTPVNINALVPYLRLNWTLVKIFQSVGFTTTGAFFSDPDLQKLLIANYHPLDLKKSKYGLTASLTGIVRADGDNPAYFINTIVDPDGCKLSNNRYLSKYPGIVQVTIKIKARSGLYQCLNRIAFYRYWSGTNKKEQTFELTDISTTTAKEYIISFSCETSVGDQLTIADDSADARGQIFTEQGSTITWTHIGYSNTNIYNNIIHHANHLPSITVATLINALRNTFGLAVWFDPASSEVEFSFLDDILKSKPGVDLTPCFDPAVEYYEILNDKSYSVKYTTQDVATPVGQINLGDFLTFNLLPIPDQLNVIARVTAEKRYYIYKQNENNLVAWFFYSDDLLAVRVIAPDQTTTEELLLETKLSTLRTIAGRTTMESKQACTSTAFDTGTNDYPLELCFDHGIQKDLNNLDYPFASPFNYDAAGNKILNISLDLYSPESIYVRHQKPWLTYLSNCEEVTEGFTLTLEQFIAIVKLFAVQHGEEERTVKIHNIHYIPKSFSIEFDQSLNTITSQAILVKPGGFPL